LRGCRIKRTEYYHNKALRKKKSLGPEDKEKCVVKKIITIENRILSPFGQKYCNESEEGPGTELKD
jgi:hypothetical protein